MLLDARTNVKNTNFPDDNYFTDKMNDRKNKLIDCATCFTDQVHTDLDANFLTAVGNEITGKNFIPPDSTTVVVPYQSALQTNQFTPFE